jgi:hypothetical protein
MLNNYTGDSPAQLRWSDDFFSITPHDVNALSKPVRAIYVGGTGDLTVKNPAGEQVLFKGVPAGTVLKINPKAIMATGTTATSIVGLV